MIPTKINKLFVITGASCIGKSTACEILFKNERDYIVMESDLLWAEVYNTPEDNYRKYRELWMRICSNISQIGMPVVLCGCAVPEQFELCNARVYFSDIIYIAITAGKDELIKRMKYGRSVTDENWLKSSEQFNEWLKENAMKTTPNIILVDNTHMSPEETANKIDEIIRLNMV
ncbi:AAA family ATPase [Clostridium swellfunianum]|uniref:AAA family ATPase n=1 Tax=Clostridium swellfunianum TaxID=1367462 RepID=UPI00202F54DC|nr:AAA family ATPase [Clostridium swellfunianum]MCM0648872.1 AAA family ATPase [Clostridium swellfunianum]